MANFNGYDSNIFSCAQEGQTAVIRMKEEAFRMSTELAHLQDMLECLVNVEKNDSIKGLLFVCADEFDGIEHLEHFIQAIKNESGYVKKEMAVERYGSSVKRMTIKINEMKKPCVVCVKGKVPVDHFGLFMAFDFRIASDNLQIEFPGLKMGITPAGAASFYLSRQLGPTLATELLLAGEPISAEDAYASGIVSQLVPEDDLKATALKKLQALYETPALAYSMTKQMIKPARYLLEEHFERSIRFMWSSIIDK